MYHLLWFPHSHSHAHTEKIVVAEWYDKMRCIRCYAARTVYAAYVHRTTHRILYFVFTIRCTRFVLEGIKTNISSRLLWQQTQRTHTSRTCLLRCTRPRSQMSFRNYNVHWRNRLGYATRSTVKCKHFARMPNPSARRCGCGCCLSVKTPSVRNCGNTTAWRPSRCRLRRRMSAQTTSTAKRVAPMTTHRNTQHLCTQRRHNSQCRCERNCVCESVRASCCRCD